MWFRFGSGRSSSKQCWTAGVHCAGAVVQNLQFRLDFENKSTSEKDESWLNRRKVQKSTKRLAEDLEA